ncbi:MAG: aminoacyl-tRNA hydrolase [Ignavibacteriales bacterium]|nr:aminoacyl-tRNA hydrolase [Ignavibacteriales bacterium]
MNFNQIIINETLSIPTAELRFRTSRSGGPGGQNVNKLETRVELEFDVRSSPSLSDRQRSVLLEALRSRIDSRGILRVVAQESRSQWKNKEMAVEKFAELLRKALRPRKKRTPTKPTHASHDRRIRSKKLQSRKKRLRRLNSEEI